MDYENATIAAWEQLKEWVTAEKFNPENEEEIQCFLYHGIVSFLGDARAVKPKPTSGKPEKLKFEDGKLVVGDMHFPDFSIGQGTDNEVVIEIKFARVAGIGNLFSGCKNDIQKMKRHHPNAKRFFVLFDQEPKYVFLSEHQFQDLRNIDPDCRILHFPADLNMSPRKEAARKAIEKMRENGIDFSEKGRKSAGIAVMGRKS